MNFSYEIKRSRFIVDIAHTPGVALAKDYVQRIKQEYPDARHHCWAYVAAAPNNSVDIGFSDDGEPSGTAGKPILAQLQGSGVGEICAVVTRYFGGIKLGTGGLVKAYGGSVQQALALLELSTKQLTTDVDLYFSYGEQKTVEHALLEVNGKVLEQHFAEDIHQRVAVPITEVDVFKRSLIERTKGKVRIEDQPDKTGL